MIEVVGNLWEHPADCRVITTNGTVKNNGECVMGRGCAAEAKLRYPSVAHYLGGRIQGSGNHVNVLFDKTDDAAGLISFPVKHNWFERADMALIERSAEELVIAVDQLPECKVVVMVDYYGILK